MEIIKWKKSKINHESGFMVRVTKEEALDLINSLSSQLRNKNPNSGRVEFTTVNQEYFSVSVNDFIDKT
jgi:hypothetical protein